MDLNQFRNEFLNGIRTDANFNGTATREQFLQNYTNTLVEADEIMDFELICYEGVGFHGKNLQIDGYCYNEVDECLIIVISRFTDSDEIGTLTLTDAKTLFKKAQNFVEDSLSGYIQKYAEDSSPGYGLAVNINTFSISKYKFYLLTDLQMSDRIKQIPNASIQGKTAEYNIWDIARLFALQTSKTGKEEIVIDLTTFSPDGIPCLKAGSNSEYSAYLCNIPGSVLADLYNHYGSRLLEGNVRSFLTNRGKINKEIRNTILNQPERFFAYNNGIASTAHSVKIVQGENCSYLTEITSLQIVNGGQTTASLASAIILDKDRANGLRDIFVPMKLSVLQPEQASVLIPKIAEYANSQNKVSAADFFSNHDIHIRIEDISRRLSTPALQGRQYGRYWFYERARGQYKQAQFKMTEAEKRKFQDVHPKQQLFTKTDLAKFNNLFLKLPHQVCAGAQKNFLKFAEWAKEQWEKDDTYFNEAYFKRMICINILFKKTDTIVKNAVWYEMGYKSQVTAYALAYLLHRIDFVTQNQKTLDYKSIWQNQDISPELTKQLEIYAKVMFDHLTSKNRGVQNVTEWAKRLACWERAKSLQEPLNEDFLKELRSMKDEITESKEAKKDQKENNKVAVLTQVAQYGVERWKKLLDWGTEQGIFNAQDIVLLQEAINIESRTPSDRNCTKIMKILQKARGEGYPD